MASLVERVAAARPEQPRWKVTEASRGQQFVPATTRPATNVVPNRSGYVNGVPPGGFDETEAAGSSPASNTDRATFLQELWEEYLACPWAWACVNVIARTVTAGGLLMEWDSDTGEGDAKQPAKPSAVLAFERLIAFCNPTQDIRQLCRNVVADLQVFGGAMIEVVWFAGIPVALYNQDFPTTFPLTDQHGNVQGYKQVTEHGQEAHFAEKQIIYITLDSARPSVFGISPTHAAEESIVAWMYLHACEKEAARRGLPPNVHIDHPAGTPEGEVKKHQDQYVARNLGPSNVGTPITTKGGGKVQELQTAKLTDILAAKKEARGEIVSSYGVPPAKVGIIESGNLGGGTGSDQNKSFWIDIINPIAQLVAEKLHFALAVKGFGVTGWHVKFGGVDYRDDKTIEDIRDQRLRNGSWTLNRLRADIGEPRVDGGDDPVLVARQDIVLWSDMARRSDASITAMSGGLEGPGGPGTPGPPPAVGTEPSKGQGGRDNGMGGEMIAAIAAAVVAEMRRAGNGEVLEHTPKLTVAQKVWNQLSRNFPATSLDWVKDTGWELAWVHPGDIATEDTAEWAASHDPKTVSRIRRKLRRGGKVAPVVLVRTPGSHADIIVDGHHRVLAAMKEGHMVRAYVGHVNSSTGGWQTLATRQHRRAETAALNGHAA